MSIYNGKTNIFSDTVSDVSAFSTTFVDIRPSTVVDPDLEIVEFMVPKNSECYWDLSRSYLETTCQLTGSDGSASLGTQGGVINNPGQTLWRTLEVTIGNYTMGSTPSLQHIRGYVENLIGTSANAKKEYLQFELFFMDTILPVCF